MPIHTTEQVEAAHSVVVLLNSRAEDATELALTTLEQLADPKISNHNTQKMLAEAGVVQALVCLLNSGPERCQEPASKVLRLFIRDETFRTVMVSEGALGALVKIVQTGTPSIRATAAWALGDLVKDSGATQVG